MAKKGYKERLAQYRKLKEENHGEPLRFYAKHFGVNVGTVSRWDKALAELSIEERIRAKLEVEYAAKYQARIGAEEAEKQRIAEEERWASENRHARARRMFNEATLEDIWPAKTEPVTWNGISVTVIGGVKNTVPSMIAGVWRDAQEARGQSANTIARYQAGQYLGRVS